VAVGQTAARRRTRPSQISLLLGVARWVVALVGLGHSARARLRLLASRPDRLRPRRLGRCNARASRVCPRHRGPRRQAPKRARTRALSPGERRGPTKRGPTRTRSEAIARWRRREYQTTGTKSRKSCRRSKRRERGNQLTERRRSRTYPAWGCHASPVLKVCESGCADAGKRMVPHSQVLSGALRFAGSSTNFGTRVRRRLPLSIASPPAQAR
jgi:hypothetical protein